jgi:Rps23 Pro-64 3,4-dihydroxylase Tpa1-like proline 4-hydroxylase
MERGAPWKLRIASFYEQWEMHLSSETLPTTLMDLITPTTIGRLSEVMLAPLTAEQLVPVDVTAHKLISGQTIKIHNDFLGGEETHRLVIQLNRGWSDDRGGLIMLFSSSSAADVRRVLRPLHGSAIAFAITPDSYHAVSTVRSGERFTLVYSFRKK